MIRVVVVAVHPGTLIQGPVKFDLVNDVSWVLPRCTKAPLRGLRAVLLACEAQSCDLRVRRVVETFRVRGD